MRLHRLEVVAFGPFADLVSIDFDALSDAGLFLLSGPTGAGKSSILDAVCFALYGDVPGDRAVAKRLRSDHAAPDVVPRVVLEATLAGRRFRIDRSPAWVRPKKRGAGTTTEQARVVISERRAGASGSDDDAWQPLSTRLDETGHLVTRLVGMTLPQFCQVALLPQGRFQAFLRARSEERQALLQQVFQTGRFDRTERWLRERRVELRRASEEHRAAVADLVSRTSEVGGDAAPDDWVSAPASLAAWIDALTEAAVTASVEQALAVEAASAAEVAAAQASAAGIELAGLRATHAAARRSWAALEAAAQEHASRRRRADKARRAASVLSLHHLAVQSRADVADLERDCSAALGTLVGLLDEPSLDADAVAERRRAATEALTDIARVRPLQRQAADLQRQLFRTDKARTTTRDELQRVEERLTAVPVELAEVLPALEEARAAVAATEVLERDLVVLRSRTRAARTAETLTTQLASAEQALAEASTARLLAREALVEIREQRLDGMAAEIAVKLAVGACCPVCGSAEHPSPAAPAPGAPDDAAEREARREVDDLEVVVEAHAQQVRGLETRLAAALAESGDTVERLLVAEGDLLSRLDRARADGAGVEAHASRVAALEAEQDALRRERDAHVAALARHDTEAAVLSSRIDDLHQQVTAVLPDGIGGAGPDADLDSLAAHHREVEGLAQRHADLTAELVRARATATSTQEAADEVAASAGFDSSAAAAAAWLDESELSALLQAVERHEREVARVSELLADDDLVRSAQTDAPDLEALAQAHHRAKEEAAAARQRDMALRDRGRRLRRLAAEMASALEAWQPVLAELDLVTDVAAMVEGKHADNRLQMRLSAYVLAHRLGQVVDAANLRLSTMSDQRYSLVHTGRRGAGETRGGLSLLVRDDWTGDDRDPATLSGGETFVVSLALALGLADVITEEAGGTDLETLFVDEGFGSLDAETLEGVMDTLDTLRDGGRVVGVVSHVPELQTRIPTQLRVHRGRTGSHATLALG
ncbi:nuclease SbcCD subunit C [Nocardioides flavus (ex Wang et al. 2016)]|uniref:Nuclease SbcCD subunit C n=1 Tax=Nocardioides flavus (ex Wang et al. 2016) TaxID=2058780 RepID=A0ABQ3HK61_9ACTN|nr:SMC family ATPase [Nocardioides flavus (ex Wang et al. 2016)]GHE18068.1 nuclease SbcCD subunit C [Nocardioides flavus (ex Wang et al. 2016)]